MMFFISMPQSKTTDQKSDKDHPGFKIDIIKNIDAKQRQCAYKERQQSAMNCTSQSSGDTKCIPIDLNFHGLQR